MTTDTKSSDQFDQQRQVRHAACVLAGVQTSTHVGPMAWDRDGKRVDPMGVALAADQECVNYSWVLTKALDAERTDTDHVREVATTIAADRMFPFPQYDGKFDGWALVVITTRIVGKGGLSFEPGDVTIAKVGVGHGEVTAWSFRRSVACAIGYGYRPATRGESERLYR